MPYVLTYQVNVNWVAAGLGLGMSADDLSTQDSPGYGTLGPNAQTLQFGPTVIPSSTTFTNAYVVAMLLTMSNDLTTQMENAATQTRIQNFSTGGG